MILKLVLQTLLIFRSSHTRKDLVNEKCIVNFTQQIHMHNSSLEPSIFIKQGSLKIFS